MRQIAKWTFLCAICIAFGFGATFLVAHSDRVIQTVVAMLPVPSTSDQAQPVAEELVSNVDPALVAPAALVSTEKLHADAVPVELAAQNNAAALPALAPLASESTVGTLSAGVAQLEADGAQTVPATGSLNAVGVIEVTRDRQVVLGASGRVDDVAVEVGDVVNEGDLLVSLDTTHLDWAVEQAEIAFETARIDFEEAGEAVDEADIAVAEANLLVAQENLAEVEAGPRAEELAAAEAAATAAWAALGELEDGPNQNEIIIAQAALRRAEIAVEAAQREYDKIAWLPEAAATSAADNLQDATINLEAARATYSETMKIATQSEIQSALANAQGAQDALNELRLQPTAASLASAQAAVAEAEAALEDVMEGPQQGSVRKAELAVREAMIALEDARLAQASSEVLAPVGGTVLAVNVSLGEEASAGQVVAVLANTADVKLIVNVEQRDIARVIIGQEVQIAIYALAQDTFTGVVEKIAPIADAGTGFVTFPVIIRFAAGPLEKILPGMTASATFVPVEGAAPATTTEATAQPTAAATAEATEEATAEPTEEATEEATAEPTEEATAEATAEATPEATAEPTEEPGAEATATPSK